MTNSMIRQASSDDLHNIQEFIRQNWDKNHILTKDLTLFNFLYSYPGCNYLNFLLYEGDDGQILGLLGYIQASQFDTQVPNSADIVWYSIWKAIDSNSNNLIGLRLMSELSKRFKSIKRGTVGASISTLPIYKALGYKIGTLSTFFAINPNQRELKILRDFIIPIQRVDTHGDDRCTINPMESFEELRDNGPWINAFAKCHHSFKTLDYKKNRYANHPRLEYKYWEIRSLQSRLFVISRKVCWNSSSLIRIVDFIGDKHLFQGFTEKLRSRVIGSSEYIEFRCSGLNYELEHAGFCKLDISNSETVLPGYFDPFVFKNIDIHWSQTSGSETLQNNTVIVVGDCDQDRPNTFVNNLE